ncbi:carbohydrate ABC transporter permease [Janthinobacterium lividum]|jgi:putative chitobiose transport system permease protein|uniref:Sugar ABC transporter permease n=1 Tax=Janthinobacterium lividum TaxID=29581 RepID=A0ABU0XWG7_9BURK|nr:MULTISPECIES: sugar ABC transporter permease [Janthinobacterium]KHA78939.1 lactose ABC transporter permease [Janthinobacterium lividum]MBR7636008.1 sugar ABC transporter permease [Janthinobacterium lividum]MCC7698665.1 sugar ABC transporter permease [Janthinobacterium sp. EB271-G4-7A]MCC7714558.1 sugar ABC transporter permease [Janthinobacterium lividum]MDQ4627874.1 sugar ABC transporter permease [Janthinobacterium lividum]
MKLTHRHTVQAWLFLTPALLLLAAFSFWPVGYGSVLAFTDYSLIRETRFVGLDNFRYIFNNEMFVSGLKNSLMFLLMVPFVQVGAIVLAVLVNNRLPGIRLFRAAFYVPVVTTVSVVGIMWGFMFHEQGALNYVMMTLKLVNAPVGWLSNDSLALFAVMFVTLWRGLGWYMVMYLAALQSIPSDMQEAAMLDGANRWQRFWKITVPMLRPTIMLCSILSVLAALKAYQEVDVLTQGGPMNSTFTALYYAYDQGLKHLKLPRALAASFVVSLFCIGIALLCLRYLKPKHR